MPRGSGVRTEEGHNKNLRIDERLINPLGLFIASFLLSYLKTYNTSVLAVWSEWLALIEGETAPHLFLKPQPLLEWVVQFGIRVAELLSTHESLESLTQSRSRTMPFGQRRHHLRMSDYECIGQLRDESLVKPKRHIPIKAGEMHSGSINSPTSCADAC